MIIRVQKHTDRYSVIDNTVLNDVRLSWKARGIIVHLLSKTDNWEVSVAALMNAGPDGREAVQSALKELSRYGYAELRTVRGDGGKTAGRQWVIFENPQLSAADTQQLDTETPTNRKTGFPFVGEKAKNGSTDERLNRLSVKPTFGFSSPSKYYKQESTENELNTECVTPAPGKTADLSQKSETQKAPQFRAAPQLFADCQYANMTTTAWRDALQELCLDLPADLDTNYYFERVRDWSDESGKASANWLKTAARFAKDDHKKHKLATLSNSNNNNHASHTITSNRTARPFDNIAAEIQSDADIFRARRAASGR